MTRDGQVDALARPRAVRQEEIAFYRANGWVHLEGLIPEAEAAALQRTIQEVTPPASPALKHAASFGGMWENIPEPSHHSAPLMAFTRGRALGDAAAALQGRAVRYWRDEVLLKMPAGHPDSAQTPWHQDHPYTPFDRSGRPQFWIALADIPPERGAMVFLSGSHRSGVLGRAFNDRSDVMADQINALIRDYPRSPPLHLRPGDATVHDGMTIHSAPPNATNDPRWAYVVQFFVADALYSGAQNPFTDGRGLEINQPFPDDLFPVVGWPPATGV